MVRKMFDWLRKIILKKMVTDGKLYYIASAIRGADSENPFLKKIFTARIRWLIGKSLDIYGDIRREKKVRLEDIVGAVTTVIRMDRHYLLHVGDALDRLFDLELIETREYVFLCKLLRGLLDLTNNEEGAQKSGMLEIADLVRKNSDLIE